MVQSIEIDNFRGFKKLRLSKVRRVNVLVGPNGTGKTTLLEAVFLASAVSPEISLRLRAWRGLGETLRLSRDRSSYEGLFNDLLFQGGPKHFSISLDDPSRGRRSCTAYMHDEERISYPLDQPEPAPSVLVPIMFEWFSGGTQHKSRVKMGPEGITFEPVPELFRAVFLASRNMPNPAENASRFSEMSKAGQADEIVSAMRMLYPQIEGLSIEVDYGIPTVYASVRGMQKKLPVPLVSEGANKYLSILMALNYSAGGLVLVDEIESGFFHKTLEDVWRGVLNGCRERDAQAFLTTHSLEALRALLPLLRSNEADICLLRTRQSAATGCEIEEIEGRRLKAALEEGFEVR